MHNNECEFRLKIYSAILYLITHLREKMVNSCVAIYTLRKMYINYTIFIMGHTEGYKKLTYT